MSSGDRKTLGIALVLFAMTLAFVGLRFEVSTDMLAFMPEGTDMEAAELSREIARSELSRTMVVTIEAPTRLVAAAASRTFEDMLRASPIADQLAFIEGGPPEDTERAIWEMYQPRRFGFLASSVEAAEVAVSDAGLQEAAADLRLRLESPMSTLMTRVAPGDPLLVLPRLFEQLEASHGVAIEVHDGRFVTRDGRFAVLFIGTEASAFDSAAQTVVLAGIQQEFAGTAVRIGAPLDMDVSGINRFAVASEAGIKADIRRVTIGSCIGLTVLLFALFRSPRLVLLAGIPVGTGVIVGCAATLAIFGRIHGVTLAFGASLIGVSVDYVVHLYCHHAEAPAGSPKATLKHIWGALRTGALTTTLGFVALAASRFPGLQEVAVFAVAGLVTAVLMTRFVIPLLLPDTQSPTALRSAVVRGLSGLLVALQRRRSALMVAAAAVVVFAVFGCTRVQWGEGFNGTDGLDASLLEEDSRVRDRVSAFDQTRFAVALGTDDESALQVNDAVARIMAEAVAAGELDAYRGVGDLVPSAQRQLAVAGVLHGDETLWPRFEAAFEAAGFRGVAFHEFRDALAAAPAEPVTLDALMASPLSGLVRSFRLHLGDRVGVLTFLEGVNDGDALAARFADVPGAVFVDQTATMRSATHGYQVGTARALVLGAFAVLLVLGVRYRDARRVAAAFVPSLVAAATTIAVLALCGIAVDLIGLTALLMVVSIGVDYGVFLVDAHDEGAGTLGDGENRDLGAALLSLFVACMTTVFGFGMLALSTHPILHAIGLTAAVGVVSCFILAPATLVLLAPRPE